MKKLLVISSYPLKGETHGRKIVGGAMATKNTLTALKKTHPDLNITVLAEVLYDTKKPNSSSAILNEREESLASGISRDSSSTTQNDNEYQEDGILIRRVWKRNSILTFPKLLKEIITREKGAQKVLIEMELANFGTIFHLLPFPVFLILLKLLRIDVTIVFQQVIDNMDDVSGHVNIKRNSLKSKLFTQGIHLFYWMSLLLSTKTIVFEQILKERLLKLKKNANVTVIPFGVEEFEIPSKAEAQKRLGLTNDEFIMLSFGFLAWYKGTDWIIEAFKKLHKQTPSRLIIAGGPNPNNLEKSYYRDYLKKLDRSVEGQPITITGFVPEEKIGDYFAACDLVVLPYRTLMSSSGPLSLALSYKKPILLSHSLKDVLLTKDSKQALAEAGLAPSDIFFTDEESFATQSELIKTDKHLQAKLTHFATLLAASRNWNRLGEQYYEELFQ